MDDERIITLYWERDESAVRETEKKYGKYCYAVAYNILHSQEDSNECVNDTWNGAWKTMPPERPTKTVSPFPKRLSFIKFSFTLESKDLSFVHVFKSYKFSSVYKFNLACFTISVFCNNTFSHVVFFAFRIVIRISV